MPGTVLNTLWGNLGHSVWPVLMWMVSFGVLRCGGTEVGYYRHFTDEENESFPPIFFTSVYLLSSSFAFAIISLWFKLLFFHLEEKGESRILSCPSSNSPFCLWNYSHLLLWLKSGEVPSSHTALE